MGAMTSFLARLVVRIGIVTANEMGKMENLRGEKFLRNETKTIRLQMIDEIARLHPSIDVD